MPLLRLACPGGLGSQSWRRCGGQPLGVTGMAAKKMTAREKESAGGKKGDEKLHREADKRKRDKEHESAGMKAKGKMGFGRK